jgi:hypothetical protein
LTSLWVASDGGYIVASWDGFFKIGAAGELVWSKSTNWINYLVVGAAGIQQADGTYLAATGQFWGNSTDDTWMIKMDSNMNGPGVTSNDAAPRTANRANARPDRNMLMRHPPAKR